LFWLVRSALRRLTRICLFGLDDLALWRYLLCGVLWKRLACVFCCFCGVLEGDSRCNYLLALRSALVETRICICLLFGYRSQLRGAPVVSVSLWFLDENGMFYQAH
jgi:hypothetical protein